MSKSEVIEELKYNLATSKLRAVKTAMDARTEEVKLVRGLKEVKEFIDDNNHPKYANKIWNFVRGNKPYEI